MREEEFKRLRAEVLRKAGLVNMKLREKFSFEEALKVNDITKDTFTLMGWEYNEKLKQVERVHYISFDNIKEKSPEPQEEPKEITPVTINSANIEVFSNDDMSHLQEFISNSSIIMQMVDMFKQNNKLDTDNINIVIELPFENDKTFKASYRVNKTINEQFKQFCKEHSEFTAKDLLSQALKEFMNKYSK
ncbi:hypothetical protein [Clostridium sp.]|uniref:hypothetical protein n=1 Tax=Clostridium sp. TaxID=1506 RepID=UPI0028510979|nr:hypothetical protein [Clostridium sp.]MDR3598502.1 hypothetical protein [Clostridium sp.]